jgi:predicted Zn-dependent protease
MGGLLVAADLILMLPSPSERNWRMRMNWTSLNATVVTAILGVALGLPSPLRGQDSAASVTEHMQKAEQALRSDDRGAAEHEFHQILAIDPQNSQAWTGLGVLLYGSGRADEAGKALRSALQINPNAKHAELFLGLTDSESADCGDAIPILDKYFASEPVGKLQRLLGLALLGCASSQANPLPALQAARRLKELYPGDADVLYESAALYTRLWNESAGELIAAHPDSYRVHQLAAEVYEAQNNYDQAIREYGLALAANPRLPQMHFRIGQLYLRKGLPDADEKAMEEFRHEKGVDPQSAVADLAMAEIERHQHKLDDAKPLYEEAIRLDPQRVEAKVGLAQTFLEQHQVDAAVQQLQAIVAEHPGNAGAHYALMLAYREQKKLPEATGEMAIFRKLQNGKDETFQNKISALLNPKAVTGESVSK